MGMSSVFLILCFSSCYYLGTNALDVGGWYRVPEITPDIKALSLLCISTSKIDGRHDKVTEVIQAYKQVVSGFNHYILYEVQIRTDLIDVCGCKLWEKPSNSETGENEYTIYKNTCHLR